MITMQSSVVWYVLNVVLTLPLFFPGLFQKEQGTLFPFRLNISTANQLPLDTITDILIGVLRLLIIIFANFSDPTYKVIRMPTLASVQGQNYFLFPYYWQEHLKVQYNDTTIFKV